MVFKAVLAYCSSHPEMIEATKSDGSVARAVARDAKLRAILESATRDRNFVLDGEILERITRVLVKSVQGLYKATFDRFVPAGELKLVCIRHSNDYSLENLVEEVRPPQVVDITDQPLPEITPAGWALKGQAMVVTTVLQPLNGGTPIQIPRLFWMKQETPIEWIPYQPGVFKFGFVGTVDHACVCAIELWETFVVGVEAPWPSGRGALRRGRNNPFSRERRRD
jgi:hypothetical protein